MLTFGASTAYSWAQVSEILDSELLGEGLIPTLQHAHDMLLVKNPKTVPYRATTYGVVSSACCLLNTMQVLPNNNSFLLINVNLSVSAILAS